jgi:hypothetical protein
MNWKKYIQDLKAKTHVLPPGWYPREVVAEENGSSAEGLLRDLKPAIKSGDVEVRQFRVWDPETERIVVVTALRAKNDPDAFAPKGSAGVKAKTRDQKPWDDQAVAAAKKLHAEGLNYAQIAERVGRTRESVRKRLSR